VSLFELFVGAQAWASAAGAEHHGPSIHEIWFPLGNFLIFAFLIWRYALPPVRGFLQSRRQEFLAAVEEISAKKRQAESLVQDYRSRLAGLDNEIAALRVSLRDEGEREKNKLLSEARTLAAKISDDADLLANQEVLTARQQLRREMAAQAEVLAQELLRRHISAPDQGRLVEGFIRSIGQPR
jgi:F-type H+-transporting ATPase subunit b